MSVETRRGGEKWHFELNDPFPDFRIRSWRLRGLRDASPRINFSGPLIANKLYFSEGLVYNIAKTPVRTPLSSALGKNRPFPLTKSYPPKNTICPWARKIASDIIHAEGVRFAVPSSAPSGA